MYFPHTSLNLLENIIFFFEIWSTLDIWKTGWDKSIILVATASGLVTSLISNVKSGKYTQRSIPRSDTLHVPQFSYFCHSTKTFSVLWFAFTENNYSIFFECERVIRWEILVWFFKRFCPFLQTQGEQTCVVSINIAQWLQNRRGFWNFANIVLLPLN